MMRTLGSISALFMACTGTLLGGLQEDIDRAIGIVHQFQAGPTQAIPTEVLQNAKGLVIIKVVKAAFLASGIGGYGIVIGKTWSGWTAPSGIGIGGAGIGLQAGAEATDMIFVLNTQAALEAFENNTKVTLGSDISVAAGPIGKKVESGSMISPADVYSYALTEGFYAGISLEQSLFIERKKANAKYYGEPVTAYELLSGKISRPSGAKALYRELDKYSK